jgi:hypothetical protein
VTTYLCDLCGKQYKSRSGLRDHRKSHAQAPQALQRPMDLQAPPQPSKPPEEAGLLLEACADLGVDPEQIISWRVYDQTVVMIVGPVGFKYFWTKGCMLSSPKDVSKETP